MVFLTKEIKEIPKEYTCSKIVNRISACVVASVILQPSLIAALLVSASVLSEEIAGSFPFVAGLQFLHLQLTLRQR